MSADLAAVIIAGGRARRLGGVCKPLLDVGGRSLLARVRAAIGNGIPVALSTTDPPPQELMSAGLPLLADGAFSGRGPLAGLLAGLDWAAANGAAWLLSVPGDMPFLPERLALRLHPGPSVATCGGQVQYLVALWPIAARPALIAFLAGPAPHSVWRFVASLNARKVDFPASSCERFLNINTPEDLDQARRLAEEAGL
jgi:molybdopterin-guanine dinucleotide biosynthesis protein A